MKNKQAKNSKNIDGIVKNTIDEVEPNTTETVEETTTESKKEPKSTKKESKPKKIKKTGFIGGVFNELKLVKWPTFKYVAGWSLTIILFTTFIGSVMGFTDYYFESGIKFVDCTSPNGSKNQSVQDCVKDLTTSLTFQKYFNRSAVSTPSTTATPAQNDAATQNPNLTSTTPIIQPTITADPNPSATDKK